MLMGIKFIAKPNVEQATILSSWMGSAKTIWNAKCSENKYEQTFARKYLPIKTYPKVNQEYSQYKSLELTPWLFECPSQILRNSSTNWFDTYQKSLKGICGRPQIKKKNSTMSILLTRELFELKKDPTSGKYLLFIGSKTNNIGFLKVNFHTKDFSIPNSIRVTKNKFGKFYVSFCYDRKIINEDKLFKKKEHLEFLRTLAEEELSAKIVGFDRGVNVAVAGNNGEFYDYKPAAKKRLIYLNNEIKTLQKSLKKKKAGSGKTRKLRSKIAKKYNKQADIRNDFAHKTSRSIVESEASIFVWEDLKTKNMVRKPKVRTEVTSDGKIKYLKNSTAAKAGLNASILNVGWGKIYNYTEYKSHAKGKLSLKVTAINSSRECVECDHIQPENRNGVKFLCKKCGHSDHADSNAAKVLRKRAIKLILDSGTELSEKGVLRNKPDSDIGHRAKIRPKIGNDLGTSYDMSKKIRGRKAA